MCITVRIDGKHISGIGELIEAVGANNVIVRGHYAVSAFLEPTMCLCPINIKQTAKALGRVAVQSEWDSMEYDLVPATADTGAGEG